MQLEEAEQAAEIEFERALWTRLWRRSTLTLSPLMSTPKSQLTAEQTLIKMTITYQRYILHPKKERRSQNKMIEGVHLWYNQIPYTLDGWPISWRKLYYRNSPIKEWEFWTPCPAHQPGSMHWEEEPLEHLVLKASRTWSWYSIGLGETLCSWRAHTRTHAYQDPGKKQWFYRSLGHAYLLTLEGILGKGLDVAHSGDTDTGGRDIRENSLVWILLEADILAPRTSSTQQPIGSRTQAKQPIEWEYSPIHKQT